MFKIDTRIESSVCLSKQSSDVGINDVTISFLSTPPNVVWDSTGHMRVNRPLDSGETNDASSPRNVSK